MLLKLKLLFRKKRKRLSPWVFEEAYSKKQALESHADTVQILALGSSFCARSFNTDLVPNAINLGTTDQDLYTTDFLFEKYVSSLPKLKKVLFFYGIFSPGHELEKTRSEKTVAIHHYVFGVPYKVDYLSSYYKAYLHRLKKYKKPASTSGYIPTKRDFDRHPLDPVMRVGLHMKNNDRGTNQTRHLEHIYKLCHKRGIKLYVIIAPVRHDYTAALSGHTDDELFHELFAFTKKSKVPVLNVMHDKSFKDDEFFDSDHLNRKGAIHMTEIIKRFIRA